MTSIHTDGPETIGDIQPLDFLVVVNRFPTADMAFADQLGNRSISARDGILTFLWYVERYLRWTQHPRWTRLAPAQRAGETPGLQMFRCAVRHAEAGRAAGGRR